MASKKSDEGKIIEILSYITWVGLVIAIVLNIEKKNEFGKFHIRQALLIMIIWLIAVFIIWIPVIGWIIGILLFVLWLLGLIYAIQGQKKEIPVIGKLAQDWFKSL